MPVLAADRVRYQGEPIALVAAVTLQVAAEAAELVDVEYEDWRASSMRRAPWNRARRSSTTRATLW